MRLLRPRRQIDEVDALARALEFPELEHFRSADRLIFAPDLTLFLEAAMRRAIGIRIGETGGKIEPFHDQRDGAARAGDQSENGGNGGGKRNQPV